MTPARAGLAALALAVALACLAAFWLDVPWPIPVGGAAFLALLAGVLRHNRRRAGIRSGPSPP